MESWLDERQACDSKMKVESHGLSYQLSIKDCVAMSKKAGEITKYTAVSGLRPALAVQKPKETVFVVRLTPNGGWYFVDFLFQLSFQALKAWAPQGARGTKVLGLAGQRTARRLSLATAQVTFHCPATSFARVFFQ